MTEPLDEFFTRCEDVLTNWQGSRDAMNSACNDSSPLNNAFRQMSHQLTSRSPFHFAIVDDFDPSWSAE